SQLPDLRLVLGLLVRIGTRPGGRRFLLLRLALAELSFRALALLPFPCPRSLLHFRRLGGRRGRLHLVPGETVRVLRQRVAIGLLPDRNPGDEDEERDQREQGYERRHGERHVDPPQQTAVLLPLRADVARDQRQRRRDLGDDAVVAADGVGVPAKRRVDTLALHAERNNATAAVHLRADLVGERHDVAAPGVLHQVEVPRERRFGQVEEAADGEVAPFHHLLQLDQGRATPDDSYQQSAVVRGGPFILGQLVEDEKLGRRRVRDPGRQRGMLVP